MGSSERLVLQPTETAQWYALVTDASKRLRVTLHEDLESYLVFLLMRFTQEVKMLASIVGLEFLSTQDHVGSQRFNNLRSVGDKCLLFSGLFPGLANKRRVPVQYFVLIGKSAYAAISSDEDHPQAALYSELDGRFVTLMDILQTTRKLSPAYQDSLSLFDATELFQNWGSKSALQSLQQITDAIPLIKKN